MIDFRLTNGEPFYLGTNAREEQFNLMETAMLFIKILSMTIAVNIYLRDEEII